VAEYQKLADNAKSCMLNGTMTEEEYYQYLEILADDILKEYNQFVLIG